MVPGIVTTDAGGRFAWPDAGKALHPSTREIVFVEGDVKNGTIGGQLEIRRAIGFDRDGAKDAFEVERAEKA
jgi:hypothetical protein